MNKRIGALGLTSLMCLGTGPQLELEPQLELAPRESASRHRTIEITFTNITHGVILTPPIFSVSRHQIDVFELGEPASLGLEMVAEGGMTDELADELDEAGAQEIMQTTNGVMPGQSITVELSGDKKSRLNLASMLLPTNDAFVAMNGPKVGKHSTFYLHAYDAGTEDNDEVCANIPGPQCGGEGYNAEAGEGFVVPHAGIHGEGELSRRDYGWGSPVAKVTVREVR